MTVRIQASHGTNGWSVTVYGPGRPDGTESVQPTLLAALWKTLARAYSPGDAATILHDAERDAAIARAEDREKARADLDAMLCKKFADEIKTRRDLAAAEVAREKAEREVEGLHAELDKRSRLDTTSVEMALARIEELEREVTRLRVQCDGCADSEIRTGRPHYDDCPVAKLERDLSTAKELLREAPDRHAHGCSKDCGDKYPCKCGLDDWRASVTKLLDGK